MKAIHLFSTCLSLLAGMISVSAQPLTPRQRADRLLEKMTLEEKIGQMNQISDKSKLTGPVTERGFSSLAELVEKGMAGSLLNVTDPKAIRAYQEAALRSRLGIPLIFGLDVIHGMRTIAPIPLGEAASFDLEAIERSARWAATETAASGIHWTFAPMVDVCVDARWGRVMEGAGEDPYYGSAVARARVKGFQGDDLSAANTIMACCKHFAAYGAAVSGKDYNSVDMSRGHFYNYYMPPYKAAAEAGVATFMNAFNDFDGVPCTGNAFLLQELLRERWQYPGFVVSDWNSVGEMVPHGYAADRREAAAAAADAGCDMEMCSLCYFDHLKELVESGRVPEKKIDDAVRRILTAKFALGLFDDPMRYCDTLRMRRTVLSDEIRAAARDMAKRSVVLLKNDRRVLPLPADIRSIALVGPLCDSQTDMKGGWAGEGVVDSIVTLRRALTDRGYTVHFAEGYDPATGRERDTGAAIRAARSSDAVIVAVGERASDSGEAKSRGELNLPAGQQELVKKLVDTGKPVVVLVMGGRPLIFNGIRECAPAILFTWWLGTEAGNALCDVIFGEYNPSGKLPMTFPAHMGQLPIYYYHKSTGRPADPAKSHTTRFIDIENDPAYPFGYGLSYTTFSVSAPRLEKAVLAPGEETRALVTVTNTGQRAGEEVVQLYVRDRFASVTRPVKELRGFRKVMLAPGESRTLEFPVTKEQLGFYTNDGKFVVEPGDFDIMAGNSSDNLFRTTLTVTKQ